MTLFKLIGLTFYILQHCNNVVQALSTYDRTDSYGVYYRTSYGDKRYTRCYDRGALLVDDCRTSYGRGRYDYRDRYDTYRGRNSYDDYNKVNLGRGTYRILSNGRDVEMTCEFPGGSHLISNVIWERSDRGYNNYRSYRSYRSDSLDHLRGRMSVRRYGDYGSILTIRDFDSSLDAGVYRCVATRSYRGYNSYSGRRETVYMEVDFNPRYNNGYNNINYGRGRDYDTYFNNRYDRYDPYNGYNRPYYQYAKTTEDKAVIDNSLTSEDDKEKKRD